MIEIGNRIETPEGVFYELEYGGEGNIYKNEDAFLNRPDEVCYVPEYAAEDREDWRVSESSDGCFTHNSLLALCKGNEEVCQDLFTALNGRTRPPCWKNGTRTAISMRSRAGMTVTIKWNGISWTGNTKSHTRENHGQDPELHIEPAGASERHLP